MTPNQLHQALRERPHQQVPALPGRTNHLRAGVLVPLIWDPEPVCVLTVRSSALRKHAGEISFPGGKPEPGDGSLERTALREAHEELGIRDAQVLGRLSSIPLYTSDFRLEPFVARVPVGPLTPDPGEVARVLHIPLAQVLDAPHIEAVNTELGGRTYLSPIFRMGGRLLYGATAYAFLELLEVVAPLMGRSVPPKIAGPLDWPAVFQSAKAPLMG